MMRSIILILCGIFISSCHSSTQVYRSDAVAIREVNELGRERNADIRYLASGVMTEEVGYTPFVTTEYAEWYAGRRRDTLRRIEVQDLQSITFSSRLPSMAIGGVISGSVGLALGALVASVDDGVNVGYTGALLGIPAMFAFPGMVFGAMVNSEDVYVFD